MEKLKLVQSRHAGLRMVIHRASWSASQLESMDVDRSSNDQVVRAYEQYLDIDQFYNFAW